MNITAINKFSAQNYRLKDDAADKKHSFKNMTFGWECRGGYYSTPRGGCTSSFIGVIIGIGAALLAAPAGLLASTLAVTSGSIVGGTAGSIIGGKLHNNDKKSLKTNKTSDFHNIDMSM